MKRERDPGGKDVHCQTKKKFAAESDLQKKKRTSTDLGEKDCVRLFRNADGVVLASGGGMVAQEKEEGRRRPLPERGEKKGWRGRTAAGSTPGKKRERQEKAIALSRGPRCRKERKE